MFDSVLSRGVGAPGRPAVGAAVSLSLHGLLFALATLLVAPHPPPLVIQPLHWRVPRGGRVPAGGGPVQPAAKPHRPDVLKPRTTQAVAPAALAPTSGRDTDVGTGPPAPGTDGPGEEACAAGDCRPEGVPGAEGAVLVLGPEMDAPRPLSTPALRYPEAALMQQLAGTVVLRCAVTEWGNVEGCTVVKSVPLLDEAALKAVLGRHYAPALYAGRPVSVWMSFPVRFVLP